MNAKTSLMTTAVSSAQRVQLMPDQMAKFILEANLVDMIG